MDIAPLILSLVSLPASFMFFVLGTRRLHKIKARKRQGAVDHAESVEMEIDQFG